MKNTKRFWSRHILYYKISQGIVHSITQQGQLDEAPGAYKDIDIVMQNQADLVKPVETLYPIGVVKG